MSGKSYVFYITKAHWESIQKEDSASGKGTEIRVLSENDIKNMNINKKVFSLLKIKIEMVEEEISEE